MRYLIVTLVLMLVACGGTVTGTDVIDGFRTITYEFSGDVDTVHYIDWAVGNGICRGISDAELPYSVEVELVGRVNASIEKHDTSGIVTIDVYENGGRIGGGTCPDGELGLIWIE